MTEKQITQVLTEQSQEIKEINGHKFGGVRWASSFSSEEVLFAVDASVDPTVEALALKLRACFALWLSPAMHSSHWPPHRSTPCHPLSTSQRLKTL